MRDENTGKAWISYVAVSDGPAVVAHVIPDENFREVILTHKAVAACGLVDYDNRSVSRTPYRSEVCPACLAYLDRMYPDGHT